MEFIAFTMLLLIGIMCISLHVIRFVCPDYTDLDKGMIKISFDDLAVLGMSAQTNH
jgi:hypothetical protein